VLQPAKKEFAMIRDLPHRRLRFSAAVAIVVGLTSIGLTHDQAPPDGKGPPPAGKDGQRPPPKKDGAGPLAAAAKELGLLEQALADAVGPAPPNIERGAKKLGIPQARLDEVMKKHRPKP
jgi:hypothetical protein